MLDGLIVDNFAGGGGASTGIEQALGRAVDIAINHDEQAIRMHEVNHPGTRHIRNNIWQIDPLEATGGKPVALAWFSPDCKHFSKAKGGKPREKSIRDLAWVVVLWGKRVRPAVILLENVEEFRTWGPLDDEGSPIKARAGETFDKWCRELRKLGYKLQFKELRACDYGAPTIRKRFFMIARCDGQPIVWPEPSHGKPGSAEVESGKRRPWRTAAEIIDWSIPCPSIFERKRELADKTKRRIAHGIMKFVVNNPKPFIAPLTHHQPGARGASIDDPMATVTGANRGEHAIVVPHVTKFRSGATGHSADEPLATVTANSFIKRPGGAAPLGVVEAVCAPFTSYAQQGGLNRSAEDPLHTLTASDGDHNTVVAAHLIHRGNGEREGQAPRAMDAEAPLGTVVAGGIKHGVVSAFLAQFSETREGRKLNPGHSVEEPVSTIVQKGPLQAVVASSLVKLRGTCAHGQPVDEPIATISAQGTHMAEVRAFLLKYYGSDQDPRLEEPLHTTTTKHRFGLVTVTIEGEEYVIVDIGMRMLTPRELFNAQGFPFWDRSFTLNAWPDPIIPPAADPASAHESNGHAKSAPPASSLSSTAGQGAPVPVNALIDLGRQVLQLSNVARLSCDVSTAGEIVEFPLPTEIASIAQTLAHESTSEANSPPTGVVGSRTSAAPSTRATPGDGHVSWSGGATTQGAADVTSDGSIAAAALRCTISPGGPVSPSVASTLTTLFSYVATAIASSTPGGTLIAASSPITLRVQHHYIIDRDAEGRPITKTAQVAKCGNSVSPPISRAIVAANFAGAAEGEEAEAA